MKFVHVLVEGQTENEFVNDILNEYLEPKEIRLNSIIAKTKRPARGNPSYKGGIVSYGKIEYDIKRMLNDTSISLVTTMIDFYGLPTDFPNYNDQEARTGALLNKITYLEMKFAEAINHRKFYPYFSIHEFEALLFSDPSKIVDEVAFENHRTTKILEKIRSKYKSPEEINLDSPPSKRITNELKSYNKVAHGYNIAIEIGVDAMRTECSHFDSWLTKIESLASE